MSAPRTIWQGAATVCAPGWLLLVACFQLVLIYPVCFPLTLYHIPLALYQYPTSVIYSYSHMVPTTSPELTLCSLQLHARQAELSLALKAESHVKSSEIIYKHEERNRDVCLPYFSPTPSHCLHCLLFLTLHQLMSTALTVLTSS